MDCKNFEEVSQLYIDGELDTECVAQFEAHLFACEGCKRELEYLQATIRGIESYPQLEARPDLADNIMARIERTASPWDFSQELGFITGVLRRTVQRTIDKIPQSVRRNDCRLNFTTAQNLPSRFYNHIPANPRRVDTSDGKNALSRKSSNQSTDYERSRALCSTHS